MDPAAAWSAARGWLTPAVLFLAINLVVATIAVASRLMSSSPAALAEGGDDNDEAAGERRGLLQRAPSSSFLAVDRRLRSSFSFSRLGLAPDNHAPQVPVQPLSGDDGAAPVDPDKPEPEPSLQQKRSTAEASQHQRAEARVERSRSEAAATPVEAPNNNRRRRAAADEELDGHGGGEEEVDARADGFIRRFREQLRLQRLHSILRYRDSLRRTGTA